jgi:hypothetical protein
MKGFLRVTHSISPGYPLGNHDDRLVPMVDGYMVNVSDIVMIRKHAQVYEIVVRNCFPLEVLPITSTLRFVVHTSENDHMERIICGSNNQVGDLVEILKKNF